MVAMAMQPVMEAGDMEEGMDGRELEASVLNKAAFLLEQVRCDWERNQGQGGLDEALKYNQHLWSLFQSEMVEDDGRLPVDIRQNILSLSAFVDKRTFDVMAFPSPEKLDILIKINRNLAEGLLAH